ncbi:hypothetical protein G7092_20950 [Mucilaginibacter sp. HC2]|uniref:hypothetical protein n=1 Tax=Mucilaginibacter inviolabilis TaxID=2714892 RepID=UPI00140AB692|nr:hypothetical protein [Mucilaginibacter inviolabilis]NHA06291.1 hypothetical protein [Mucilaginibacter inviolabilis]
MKITDRMFTITIIILSVLLLVFGFGWVNSDVSYKYEIQDTLVARKALDEHQRDIIHGIIFCKIAAVSSFVLLILTLVIHELEPTFKGRVQYVKKK